MPAGAHLEQQRLARRVGEELRDRGGEDVGRLVAVVPRRDAERLPAARRSRRRRRGPTRAHAPTSGRNDGTVARRRQRVVEAVGQERAEVGRLHGARTAARGDGEVVAERVPEAGRGGVRRAAALERVTAHDADQVASGHPRRQGRVDVVVVQRHRQGVLGTGAAPRPGVGPRVEGVVVARCVVEVAGGVERGPVGVDRDAGDLGQHDRTGTAYDVVVAVGEVAAEEQRPRRATARAAPARARSGRARRRATRRASGRRRRACGRGRRRVVTSMTRPWECFTGQPRLPP